MATNYMKNNKEPIIVTNINNELIGLKSGQVLKFVTSPPSDIYNYGFVCDECGKEYNENVSFWHSEEVDCCIECAEKIRKATSPGLITKSEVNKMKIKSSKPVKVIVQDTNEKFTFSPDPIKAYSVYFPTPMELLNSTNSFICALRISKNGYIFIYRPVKNIDQIQTYSKVIIKTDKHFKIWNAFSINAVLHTHFELLKHIEPLNYYPIHSKDQIDISLDTISLNEKDYKNKLTVEELNTMSNVSDYTFNLTNGWLIISELKTEYGNDVPPSIISSSIMLYENDITNLSNKILDYSRLCFFFSNGSIQAIDLLQRRQLLLSKENKSIVMDPENSFNPKEIDEYSVYIKEVMIALNKMN